MTNAHNAIIQIIENKNLITILMVIVYAMMAIMIVVKIIYVNSALSFGIYTNLNFLKVLFALIMLLIIKLIAINAKVDIIYLKI